VSAPFVALSIVAVILTGTIAFALFSVRRLKMDPQQYLVGGRSFSTLLLWVLLAGEIYTSFTFLGAAGWVYGFGAPAYYILAYQACAYIIGYFALPAIWRIAKEHNLLTAPDFFVNRYNSRALGVAIGALQFFMLVPYVALQLSGLQHLLTIAGYGVVGSAWSVAGAFVAIAFFVFTAGLRGTAWASIVKDALVLAAVAFAGIAIPIAFFGSPAAMFDQLIRVHPQMLLLPSGAAPKGAIWYVTTVLLTSIGFFMGPGSFNAVYSARSESVVRRNTALMPIYGLMLLLLVFAGYAALLVVPGLKGTHVDESFLLLIQHYYPPWVLGLVTGAGALAALVPASALLLAAAGVFAKNVLGDGFRVATSDAHRTWATRLLVLVVAAMALALWIAEPATIGELLLIYYNGITQFAPGVFAALIWPRANAWGVAAGLATGLAIAIYLTSTTISLWSINPGFVALAANVVVMVVVSLATSKPRSAQA